MQLQAAVDDLCLLVGAPEFDLSGALDVELAAGRDGLLEIVMDLGRRPEARLTSGDVTLLEREVTEEDLSWTISRIGEFGGDNRAGIERTLHRISAIRNRADRVVGLTCRVGRSVFGTIEILRDHIESGRSILIMGRPGVGKTTMLREAARVLASEFSKRVVVVDTSNEIAGDGDIPHPAIGKARRMQVNVPERQHLVMIEAVENHMPEVIVIDEIGTEAEAIAARTIAERGVQLIGTAHGNNLDNLMLNPTLTDLIGGIQSVTLGDEEARRRRSQKSVLERKAPPTFDVLVEIQERRAQREPPIRHARRDREPVFGGLDPGHAHNASNAVMVQVSAAGLVCDSRGGDVKFNVTGAVAEEILKAARPADGGLRAEIAS